MSGQLGYVLYNNTGAYPYQTIGPTDPSCIYQFQGAEQNASAESASSYVKYCVGFSPVMTAVPIPDKGIINARVIENTVGIRAKTGHFTHRRTETDRRNERVYIKHNIWTARSNVFLTQTIQSYRKKEPTYLIYSIPILAFPEQPPAGFCSYALQISNGVTGRLIKSLDLPSSGGPFVFNLNELPQTADGVPLDQPFKVELVIKGTFDTPDKIGSPEVLSGSKVQFGFYPSE
jgi:hypothetical protein